MSRTTITLTGALLLALNAAPVLAAGNADAGKTKSAACAACHGGDGNSAIAANPKLAGQHADYLAQALREYKSGARKNAIMQGMAKPLSEQDIADISAFFASQSSKLGVIPLK
jgi:cytochrome c553